MNGDSSWFMTFAEKVLDGAVPYVDVSDPNPPAAFLAYLPSLALARLLHVAPEAVVVILTFTGASFSIALAGVILSRSGLLRQEEAALFASFATFAILFVPAFCFAEREHFAVILLLPYLALCAARSKGNGMGWAIAAIAGAMAALALTFKPYYLLPFVLAALCAPIQRRDWRAPVTTETVVAALAFGFACLVVVWRFPSFLRDTLPIIGDVYLPARGRLLDVALAPAFVANVAVLAGMLWTARALPRDPRVSVLCAASVGYMATFLVQSKGWMNHAYPGLAFALLAGAFFVTSREEGVAAARRRDFKLLVLLPCVVVAPLCFGALFDLTGIEEHPGLRAEVQRLAPAHPRLAALAEELGLGHPLVRQLGGTWIGQQNCLWTSNAVRYLLARDGSGVSEVRRARLLALKEQDERRFAEDVRQGRPDVLLVETPELETWARGEPPLAGVFEPYRLAGRAGAVSIWLRTKG